MKPDLNYQVALTLIPGVGPLIAKALTEHLGSAEKVINAKPKEIEEVPGARRTLWKSIAENKDEALKRAEKEITFIDKHKIHALFYQDDDYPSRLKECDDSPYLLYYKGKASLNAGKIIAVVGSRKSTEYGRSVTNKLINELKDYNILVVSGLALGIDIEAHRSSLEHNLDTIGVLAHGLDRIYPSLHRDTAEKMLERGGLLSEFLSETNPDRENFPKRNRIVAGMADATIVIESGEKGGSLISADIAHSYGREVFAFPGRTIDKYSIGCNRLIKSQKAIMIENAEDLIQQMGWGEGKKEKQLKLQMNLFTTPEQMILNFIAEMSPIHIDSLSSLSELSLPVLKNHLFQLEMKGVIKMVPGNRIQLAEMVF
ncbi:MAG: DNA-processing protein DprA [Bacteroidetes bacterium]|nr:DNA-processing protein DprA [Bacteroidota bacterium]